MNRLIWIGKASPLWLSWWWWWCVYILFDPWVSSPKRSWFQEILTMPSWTTWSQILPIRSLSQRCTPTERDHQSKATAKHVSSTAIWHADTVYNQVTESCWPLFTSTLSHVHGCIRACWLHCKKWHQCKHLIANSVSLNKWWHLIMSGTSWCKTLIYIWWLP